MDNPKEIKPMNESKPKFEAEKMQVVYAEGHPKAGTEEFAYGIKAVFLDEIHPESEEEAERLADLLNEALWDFEYKW